ncbi:hypothetical protein Pelo_18040 [Pelomyxa schiedti]|nr:hypothetical protein Pelo_18040 [Pelomyxa schiedti]
MVHSMQANLEIDGNRTGRVLLTNSSREIIQLNKGQAIAVETHSIPSVHAATACIRVRRIEEEKQSTKDIAEDAATCLIAEEEPDEEEETHAKEKTCVEVGPIEDWRTADIQWDNLDHNQTEKFITLQQKYSSILTNDKAKRSASLPKSWKIC